MNNTARNNEIERLYNEGATYSEIATTLKLDRSIVAGVLDRAKKRGEIKPRNDPDYVPPPKPEPKPRPASSLRLPPLALPVPAEADPVLPGVALLDAQEHHCRWLIGPMRYCGLPKVQGRSFCPDHTAVAYTTYTRKP
jgi:hypothetical protein